MSSKANEELEEKIRKEGKDAVVIDSNMTESVEADKDADINDESVEVMHCVVVIRFDYCKIGRKG